MPDIKDQKLLYHLTSFENLAGILAGGLKPRASLQKFSDVADPEILVKRKMLGLDHFVPFHWFCNNPFDGGVKRKHPQTQFLLITVRRSVARRSGWRVIPRHPLANDAFQLLDYQTGFEAIEWEVMNTRDYHNSHCKSVCMAECLSPAPVPHTHFFKIFVPDEAVATISRSKLMEAGVNVEVDVKPGMFS